MTIFEQIKIRRSKFCEEFPEKCGTKEKDILLSEEEIFNLTFEFMKRGKKDQLGHQINDMIVSCEFSGHPKLKTKNCMEYFTYLYDPHLGNCYAFSSGGGLRPRLYVTEPDAWQEIKDMDLVLNVEHDEYLDYTGVTPGLIIAMHEDMAYPQLYAHGVHVYADHSYNLAVAKVSVYLLPQPYKSNCTDYNKLPFHSLSNMELTPRICTVECVMYHQRRTCQHSYVTDNVVLFSDEMPYDPDKVTKGDKQCAMSLSEDYKEYCRSLCSVPC
ncbi:amiloride-sensitive sodium channel subunit beta-2-like, partial [Stegodyphus dumicola]|uniref:amiloride-sensitive sodium channel subunit beta-2-like n=1 Tax=Stegodyphus dumicola TaxID=202533 RepID=UPI0015A7DEC6